MKSLSLAKGYLALWRHLYLTRAMREQFKRFQDKHKGQMAVIIGNGPSVRLDELEQLEPFVTFACNRFHLCYDKTSFRPTYTVVVDNQMVNDFGDEIAEKAETPVFCSNSSYVDRYEQLFYLTLCNLRPFEFNDLRKTCYIHSGDSVVVSAIQLAYFMGMTKVVLYGVDHSFSYSTLSQNGLVEGEGNHFIPNYRDQKLWYPPNLKTIEQAFQTCASYLKAHGGEIVNTTPNTKLEEIPKCSFPSVIGDLHDAR